MNTVNAKFEPADLHKFGLNQHGFVQADGTVTDDVDNALLFDSMDEAERIAKSVCRRPHVIKTFRQS